MRIPLTIKSQSLVLEFLNTVDPSTGTDILSDPYATSRWAEERIGEIGPPPDIHDLAWAVEVRGALRFLLSGRPLEPPAPASTEVLGRASRLAALSLTFDAAGPTLHTFAVGPDRILGEILVAAHDAVADGSWRRIKLCRNPECRRAFYDQSRNHSRIWCRMAECGNKMKARRFRLRQRSG